VVGEVIDFEICKQVDKQELGIRDEIDKIKVEE